MWIIHTPISLVVIDEKLTTFSWLWKTFFHAKME